MARCMLLGLPLSLGVTAPGTLRLQAQKVQAVAPAPLVYISLYNPYKYI